MKNRFEHISPAEHDMAAVVIRYVSEQLLTHLDWVALKPKRIMDVGCGAGYCTRLLQKRYPTAELWAVDDSPQMLAYASQSDVSSINWSCSSLDTLPVEDSSVDLVVANLILPWCADLKKMMQEWLRVLKPEGLLLFTTFGPDTLRELQGQPIQLPHFVDMHHLGDALVQAHFSGPVLDVDYITLTYREQQRLQDELQLTSFISGQEVFEPLLKNTAGVIPLTYEIVYGHAWKPDVSLNNVSEENVVKFPLAHLRGRTPTGN